MLKRIGSRGTVLVLGGVCVLVGTFALVPFGRVGAEERGEALVARFRSEISDFEAQVEADRAAGRIGALEAFARWWNFHLGALRPALVAAQEGGAFGDAATAELYWAAETGQFSARVDARVVRGVLAEDEGRELLERFQSTGNPIVFEAVGELFVLDAAEPHIPGAIERFDEAIAERSRGQNLRELERLTEAYGRAKDAGAQGEADLLALEIRRIHTEGLADDHFDVAVRGHEFVYWQADPEVSEALERVRAETRERSLAENRSAIEAAEAAFEAAKEADDEVRMWRLALEIVSIERFLEQGG